MTQMRIGIDGYNLALPQGTGVATYGYSLAKTLREMDYGLDGVFGLTTGAKRETRELFFFEHFGRGDLGCDQRLESVRPNWCAVSSPSSPGAPSVSGA